MLGFPDGSAGEESSCNSGDTRDAGSIPGLGRFPGEENGNPLQFSCLENSMDRGAWWATVHGVAKSQTERFHFQCVNIKIRDGLYTGFLQHIVFKSCSDEVENEPCINLQSYRA